MDAESAHPAVSDTQHPYTPVKDSKTTQTLPPPATYSSSSPPRRRNYSRCRYVISTCCLLFLALILTVGLGVFIEWLIIRPKNGNYDLQDAHLQTFNLTRNSNGNGNGTSSYNLDTHITFQFLFSNPNAKLGFDVKAFNVHVSYSGLEIGQSADVAPFYQGKRSNTDVRSEVQSVKTVLGETLGDGLQGEIGLGNVSLVVVMNAKVRTNHQLLKGLHPFRKVHLTCLVDLEVPKGSALGNLVSKSCKVKRENIH